MGEGLSFDWAGYEGKIRADATREVYGKVEDLIKKIIAISDELLVDNPHHPDAEMWRMVRKEQEFILQEVRSLRRNGG